MDPERVPPLPQSEASPVHSLDKDTSGIIPQEPLNPSQSNVPRPTARIITSNLSPESPGPEKLEVSEISSFLQHINDYFAQSTSIHSPLPVPLPESRRETGLNNLNERFSNTLPQIHSGIDWIVPSTKEGVSNYLNTLNLFTY